MQYKAALTAHVFSGSTIPTSPRTGDWFLHTPTGRSVLLLYVGGAWRSVESFGTMTIYIDGASGTDGTNQGFGTGADAYATMQYAIDSIPGTVGGNVAINGAAGTYAEDVVINGKNYTGNYTITITGVMTVLDTLTSSASTQGSGSTQGTVVRSSGTWTSNQRQRKFIRFTSGANSGIVRLIDSNTTTTLTIADVWPGGAPGTDTFVVEEWATIIRSINVGTNQIGIVIEKIGTSAPAGSPGFQAQFGSSGTCRQFGATAAAGSPTYGNAANYGGKWIFDTCFLTNAADGERILIGDGGVTIVWRSIILPAGGSTNYGVLLEHAGVMQFANGCILDANGAAFAALVSTGMFTFASSGSLNRVRNASSAGIGAINGGHITHSQSGVHIVYSGNTADTYADAGSYSSIS